MQVNKTTVNTTREKKVNDNHYSRNGTCFKKKNLHYEKKGITLFFCEFLSQ